MFWFLIHSGAPSSVACACPVYEVFEKASATPTVLDMIEEEGDVVVSFLDGRQERFSIWKVLVLRPLHPQF